MSKRIICLIIGIVTFASVSCGVVGFDKRQLGDEVVSNVEPFDRIGCWLGTNGGALIIEDARIDHLTSNKKYSYSYSVPEAVGDDNANGVVLEVKDVPNLEFIRPFTYLGYEGKDETLGVDRILVRGYETMEAFDKKEFVTSEFFYRDPCADLK